MPGSPRERRSSSRPPRAPRSPRSPRAAASSVPPPSLENAMNPAELRNQDQKKLIAFLRAENESLESDNKAFMQSIVSLESENTTLNEQLKGQTDALHKKTRELKKITKQRDDYKGRLEQDDREAHNQRDKVKAQYKKLKKENEGLKDEFEELTKENERLEAEVEETLATADKAAREHWRKKHLEALEPARRNIMAEVRAEVEEEISKLRETNERLQTTIREMGALGDKARAVVRPAIPLPDESAASRKKKRTRRRRREGRK